MDLSLHRLEVTLTRSATWGFAPRGAQKSTQKKNKVPFGDSDIPADVSGGWALLPPPETRALFPLFPCKPTRR